MRKITAFIALACLIPAAAFGESFISTKYGFSAEFPKAPTVGEPRNAETDDAGKVISQSVMIQAAGPGAYTAMVTADMYTVPVKIDAAITLTAMVKGFAAQLDATLGSNKAGKFEDKPARFFSYDTADHSVAGNGMIVLVPSKKPRIYLVVNMHTPRATPEDAAALDKFLASFQFE